MAVSTPHSLLVTDCVRCGQQIKTESAICVCPRCGLLIEIRWAWDGEVTQ